MQPTKIHQLFNIRRRFLRSAQLERDFRDPSALEGYIVTQHISENLGRIAEGLSATSGQRAWRITGDYGSGKSSFALLLAHLFAGKDSDLPPQIRRAVDLASLRKHGCKLFPILVTGSREPLATALTRALAKALEEAFDGRSRSRILQETSAALSQPNPIIPDAQVLQFIQAANSELIAKGKSHGLLIILDELGKFLEFAALHPERQDIFFLQQLAELSTRSGKEPLFTIGLLHQGFRAYSDLLSQSAQKEWEKVAGRFEELLFDQPLDQITHLIAAALNVSERLYPKGADSKARSAMQHAASSGWYGTAPVLRSLLEAAPKLYPLHPTTIPALVRLFTRFGQNERSLFSFLLSNEPYGLQSFSDREAKSSTFYRIYDLYDYAASNFGQRLSVQSYRNHWNHIDSLVRSFPSQDEIQIAVLKTVGLLNLLNAPNLIPSDEAIIAAVSDGRPETDELVKGAIQHLHRDRHVLYSRGRAGGYCLWSHTSVNLDAAYEEAARAIGVHKKVSAHIRDYLDLRPVVARRHYIQTGNLRHFDVQYCTLSELEAVASQPTRADGRILVPLCETPDEVRAAETFTLDVTNRPDLLVGITDPLGSLAGLLVEVDRWTWVERNTPELKDDQYAAEEVARQLRLAKHTLERRIEHYAGLRQASRSSGSSICWYWQGRRQTLKSGSQLLELLSDICDGLYSLAPRVHNELVNRQNVSSAAASARMRLIEGMFASADKPLLGLDASKRPPEMSMYFSVFARTNLHVAQGSSWKLQIPKRHDPCNLTPSLSFIPAHLSTKPDARVPVVELFDTLRRPPYGVRTGLLPILLVVVLLEHQHDIALYENGTFLSYVGGEEIQRLIRNPAEFELQMFTIQGIRRSVFDKMSEVLGVRSSSSEKSQILQIVRPLCSFVARLPEYTRKTQRLTLNARAIRDAILQAREPANLIFRDLPVAMGLDPFGSAAEAKISSVRVEEFVECFKSAADELKLAYPELKARIRSELLKGFQTSEAIPVQQFRERVAQRCQNLNLTIRDIELRAFCLRMLDSQLPESDWLESVGSYVANTPPSRWKDEDEQVFKERLELLMQKFLRIESILFKTGNNQEKPDLRVALTRRSGAEVERVVQISPEDEESVKSLETNVLKLLDHKDTVSIAALSRILWNLLDKSTHE